MDFQEKCAKSPWCGVIWSEDKMSCAMRYDSTEGWVLLPPWTVEWMKTVKIASVEEICSNAGGSTGNILWRQFSKYMGYR